MYDDLTRARGLDITNILINRNKSYRLGLGEHVCIFCSKICVSSHVICGRNKCVNKWIERHKELFNRDGVFNYKDFFKTYPNLKRYRVPNKF